MFVDPNGTSKIDLRFLIAVINYGLTKNEILQVLALYGIAVKNPAGTDRENIDIIQELKKNMPKVSDFWGSYGRKGLIKPFPKLKMLLEFFKAIVPLPKICKKNGNGIVLSLLFTKNMI